MHVIRSSGLKQCASLTRRTRLHFGETRRGYTFISKAAKKQNKLGSPQRGQDSLERGNKFTALSLSLSLTAQQNGSRFRRKNNLRTRRPAFTTNPVRSPGYTHIPRKKGNFKKERNNGVSVYTNCNRHRKEEVNGLGSRKARINGEEKRELMTANYADKPRLQVPSVDLSRGFAEYVMHLFSRYTFVFF